MRPTLAIALLVCAPAGCKRADSSKPPTAAAPTATEPNAAGSLAAARRGFQSKLVGRGGGRDPVPDPPPAVFRKVKYPSPAGQLAAYLSPDPADGRKRPAIVWITGGDCNSIGDVWTEGKPANDQSAAAYRKAGVVMMFPSLRGGNDNPGQKEGFLGEVDDVLAAADFLAKQPHVDPARIYLGGHSTGGTLVLLVSELSDRFRAVFAFGPVEDVAGYGPEYMPFNFRDPQEVRVRSPLHWLAGIKSPTFVIEGAVQGNLDSLQAMAKASSNPNAHFVPVRRANHFSVLAPVNRLLAAKVVADTGPACNITLTEDEANAAAGGR